MRIHFDNINEAADWYTETHKRFADRNMYTPKILLRAVTDALPYVEFDDAHTETILKIWSTK